MLAILVGGTLYSLDDGTICYYVGDDGLGLGDVALHSSRGYLQHGMTIYDFRLEPRRIRLFLEIEGSSWSDLWNKRAALLRLFAPNQDVSLRLSLPYGTRQIDCRYSADLDLPSSGRRAFKQDALVSLVAADPTFYDPTAVGVMIPPYPIGNEAYLAIPLAIPMEVGGADYEISYTGSFRAYPIIRITGPITNPTVANTTTGKSISLTTTIAAGDYYEIDCRYGYKTCVDANGVDKMSTLSGDLEEFALEATSDGSASRANLIRVSGSGITSETNVTLEYYKRYLGI